jgi:GrpB-like predicted nucleotidyltransferase (UPF0157 family)
MLESDLELIGGPEHREIKLVAYDQKWPQKFGSERQKIVGVLGAKALRVDHVGSTSIEGLTAKPIIDIQLSVDDPDNEAEYLPELEQQGYILRVRQSGHRMVRTPQLDVQVHICKAGSDWERRHLLFRDWLRHDTKDREAYAALKEHLAKQRWETMNHYADAKGALIQEITERAEAWAARTNWQP